VDMLSTLEVRSKHSQEEVRACPPVYFTMPSAFGATSM
jgi:hypothetical protein